MKFRESDCFTGCCIESEVVVVWFFKLQIQSVRDLFVIIVLVIHISLSKKLNLWDLGV